MAVIEIIKTEALHLFWILIHHLKIPAVHFIDLFAVVVWAMDDWIVLTWRFLKLFY